MSDEEYQSSSSEEDFSASEDEWKPGNSSSRRRQASDESDDDDSDFDDESPSSKRRDAKSTSSKNDASTKQSKKRKSTSTSLRTKLFNKYKPPPKTVQRNIANQSNQGEQQQKQKQKSNTAQGVEKKAPRAPANKRAVLSDSESSGDDYLVQPDQIDLKSSFFDVNPKPSTSSKNVEENLEENKGDEPPKFDCNAGMRLSDSEENDDDDETESSKDITITNPFTAGAAKPVDLGYLQDYAENMEKAKTQFKKNKEKSLLQAQVTKKVDDVTSLLAIGEGTSTAVSTTSSTSKKTKNPKRQPKKSQASQQMADTDSELEEVEDEINNGLQNSFANGIEICVDLPQKQRKDKKSVDAEACLKRQLNRIIKENQIMLHKTSLLCHIYYGLYINKIANNIYLMPLALKMLPSKNVYPSGQTEIKYFQSMVTWYKSAVKICDDRKYPKFKVNPIVSIGVQMKNRHAVCKRDFIIMFIILLRAMGMQCRLICNLFPLPLKPPQSSLCSLKMNEESKSKNKKKKTNDNEEQKKGIKKESIKSPSMSTEELKNLRQKVEALEKDIAQRKMEKLKPMLSFEEELALKTEPKKTGNKEKEHNEKDLKRKSKDLNNEPVTKKRVKETPVTKSEYFSESGVVKNCEVQIRRSKRTPTTKSEYFSESGVVKNCEIIASKSTREQKLSASKNNDASSENISKSAVKASGSKRSTRSKKPIEDKTDMKSRDIPKIHVEANADGQSNLDNNKTRGKISKTFRKSLQSVSAETNIKLGRRKSCSPVNPSSKSYISTEFLKTKQVRSGKADQPTESTPSPSPRKTRASAKQLKVPQLDGADDIPKSRNQKKAIKKGCTSDDDFEIPPPNKKQKHIDRVKNLDRRVLSPHLSCDDDDEETAETSPSKSKNINMWVEVYCELEAQWVCVDLFKGKVNCIDSIRKSIGSSNLAYVFAFNNDATVKDVTARYCVQWAFTLRKNRVEQSWLDEALEDYVLTKPTKRDLNEDSEMRRIHLDKPIPTTISEYKDHPLYALERHLLKFQVLYPPNALTLGFVRGEPVYARECVHTCHSREIWLKEARVVKPGEKPCKIVKARPKWDKFSNTVIKDLPLEIFGYWQTQEYDPPTAENGIVPRNAYGNVELFKECMLPKKTVHLHLPGLNKVCKKLGIDCASAVIGFDFHQGSCHPLYDGFVVCEEFADVVVDAWNKEQEEAERKEQDKYESRVYGNWKKLIKGLLIRERLKLKYNF